MRKSESKDSTKIKNLYNRHATTLDFLFLLKSIVKGNLYCPVLSSFGKLKKESKCCCKHKAYRLPFLFSIFLIFSFMENGTKKCRECKADIPTDAKVCQFCKSKQ